VAVMDWFSRYVLSWSLSFGAHEKLPTCAPIE